MKKPSSSLTYLLMFGVLVAAPLSSNAQTNTAPSAAEKSGPVSDQGWKKILINVSWRGGGVRLDELGKVRTADVVYSGTADTPGNLMFNCYGGRPSVSFATEPTNMRTMLTDAPDSRRMSIRRPKISVDGKRISGEDWIYMPKINVYRARRTASFKTLYNATVLGADVRVKSRGDDIRLNTPPIDDVFKNFGAECGLGRLAKR